MVTRVFSEKVYGLFRFLRLLLTGRQSFFVTFWVVFMPLNLLCGLVFELSELLLPYRWNGAILVVTGTVVVLNSYLVGPAVVWCAYRNRPLDNWQWLGSFSAVASMLAPLLAFI